MHRRLHAAVARCQVNGVATDVVATSGCCAEAEKKLDDGVNVGDRRQVERCLLINVHDVKIGKALAQHLQNVETTVVLRSEMDWKHSSVILNLRLCTGFQKKTHALVV
jgi:hypothetical protein